MKVRGKPADASLNRTLADRFEEIARLLDDHGANPFRIRAYRRAAETLRAVGEPVSAIIAREGIEGLEALPGIGAALARMIGQYVDTGRLPLLDDLRGAADPVALLRSVPAVGATLAKRLHAELGIDSLEELELAAHDGRLAAFEGIGPKRLAAIRESLGTRLARRRPGHVPEHDPPLADLLELDEEYRQGARAGTLRKITPRRFNPQRRAWLPVLHARKGEWDYTALFSNTALAHELGKTRDWVVIYFQSDRHTGQCTAVTALSGPCRGKRVVRGREPECEAYYARPARSHADARWEGT
ncbi:MAG TPA: helix-hairpin-helix domain-containing protein [Gemmatimonadales bacterium]|nr:helix-hairpin-helix domain-containing protein [Gemmatimonadales bacterium]